MTGRVDKRAVVRWRGLVAMLLLSGRVRGGRRIRLNAGGLRSQQ